MTAVKFGTTDIKKRNVSYELSRTVGMDVPDAAAGVYSGVGSIFERDYRDAYCHPRARSVHAEFGGKECFGRQQRTAFARIGAARGGPRVQRASDQHCGTANAASGIVDESFAAGACGIEPGTAAIADSIARRKLPARFAN